MRFYIPTKEDVQNLNVGDQAYDWAGNLKTVDEISGRGIDIKGKAFVCFYLINGPHSRVSSSLKEGQLNRTVELSNEYSSHELDEIERIMLKNNISQFETLDRISINDFENFLTYH